MFNFFKKRELKIAIIFCSISLFLLLLSQREKQTFVEDVSHSVQTFIYPVQNFARSISDTIGGFFSKYVFLLSLEEENHLLQQQIYDLKIENDRINEALSFRLAQESVVKKNPQKPHIVADIIYQRTLGYSKNLVINKGKNDGVFKNAGVYHPIGIVGKIIEVSDHYAMVQLIIDFKSKFPALMQRTRHQGLISGNIDGTLSLDFIPRESDLKLDDIVVTSGFSNIFTKGLKIGRITQINKKEFGLFQSARVEPYVEFNTLEQVFIISKTDAQQEIYYFFDEQK